ncbi:MAG TPA: exodeoxyribonuclease III [Candidatus Magasanikbacteria bacterium]|nr:exodeoxyribonuclease III [Candidatus Magasanikbacteria bacterium]
MPNIKLCSWNVNGVRAAEKKGIIPWIEKSEYDVICLQETKVSDSAILSEKLRFVNGYDSYWQCATEKKGYSGVAVYTRLKPVKVVMELPGLLGREGRVIRLDFEKFVLLNIYFPNGGAGEHRLKYKLEFYDEFLKYVKHLKQGGHEVVICGDVNTAHNEIDLARPKENEKSSGFMPIEREWLDKFVEAGLVDSFRNLHPKKVEYSWWDMKTRARERNVGWRIDYFLVTEKLMKHVTHAEIHNDVLGSDHCPVSLTLNI